MPSHSIAWATPTSFNASDMARDGAASVPARWRRAGVLASVAAIHLVALWIIVIMNAPIRRVLPSVMQVVLIPEPAAPQIAPPIPSILIASPDFESPPATPSLPLPMPLPTIEITPPATATPAQPLPSPAIEPKPDSSTNATLTAAQPQPPAAAAITPPAASAAPDPVVVQAAVPPSPVNIPPTAIQYLQMPQVIYPALSRRRRETGLVIVSTLVDRDGNPGQVQVFQSSGFDRLDDAAIAAVRKARFKPYVQTGQPTAGWARIPISFDLES